MKFIKLTPTAFRGEGEKILVNAEMIVSLLQSPQERPFEHQVEVRLLSGQKLVVQEPVGYILSVIEMMGGSHDGEGNCV